MLVPAEQMRKAAEEDPPGHLERLLDRTQGKGPGEPMQLTAAVPGNTPVLVPVLSVVNPVLPSSPLRNLATVEPLAAKSSRVTAPGAGSRNASIPVPPALPVLPDTGISACNPVPGTTRRPVAPPTLVRSRSASVSRRISKSHPFVEQDIPLYLVPHIIARAIWQRGDQTFRISVVRTKKHYYTIRLRTARQPGWKEEKTGAKGRSGKNEQRCPEK